jgi:hypothetical protein
MPSLLACFGVGVMGHPVPLRLGRPSWPATPCARCALGAAQGRKRFLARFASRRKKPKALPTFSLSRVRERDQGRGAFAVGAPEAAPSGGRAQGVIRQDGESSARWAGAHRARPRARPPLGHRRQSGGADAGCAFSCLLLFAQAKRSKSPSKGETKPAQNHRTTHGEDRHANPARARSQESASQRVSESASQRVSESASQRVSESASQRVSETMLHPDLQQSRISRKPPRNLVPAKARRK